jgi:hypothetical protein
MPGSAALRNAAASTAPCRWDASRCCRYPRSPLKPRPLVEAGWRQQERRQVRRRTDGVNWAVGESAGAGGVGSGNATEWGDAAVEKTPPRASSSAQGEAIGEEGDEQDCAGGERPACRAAAALGARQVPGGACRVVRRATGRRGGSEGLRGRRAGRATARPATDQWTEAGCPAPGRAERRGCGCGFALLRGAASVVTVRWSAGPASCETGDGMIPNKLLGSQPEWRSGKLRAQ